MATTKEFVFIFKQTPYGGSKAREGIEALYAAAAFDQKITVVFYGDGVFQLMPEQMTEENQKNIAKLIRAFELYDITNIYADQGSVTKRQIDLSHSITTPTLIGSEALNIIINNAHCVFTF